MNTDQRRIQVVNRHAKRTPYRHAKGTPFVADCMKPSCFFVRLTGAVSSPRPDHSKASRAAAVKHGRRPSAEPARSVLDGGGEHGAALETGGSRLLKAPVLVASLDEAQRVQTPVTRNPAQARFLKRQLSLPVSTMSQWWVRRSSSAVVILASPKTLGHSPNARLVVTITEVCS